MEHDDKSEIDSISDLLTLLPLFELEGALVLFRGQGKHNPLLPKVTRKDPSKDTTSEEREMLSELSRRLASDNSFSQMSEWDRLVYAQHYGLATRLLDWTTNPLVALWFACSNQYVGTNGKVYILIVEEKMKLTPDIDSPFTLESTKIVKPNLNNERIASQNGWFTAHHYSEEKSCFQHLGEDEQYKEEILSKTVRGKDKPKFLKHLNGLGINHEYIYKGMGGACDYINWLHGK